MIDEELASAPETAEIESETKDKTEVVDATDASETDEEKNERVQKEAAEASKKREEKRQQSVQRRMDELTADKYAARKLADQLAEQNAKILALLEGKQSTSQVQGEPTREQFTDYEDFVTARAEYRAELKTKAVIEQFSRTQDEKQTKSAQETSQREIEKQFLERRSAAEKEIPDFVETVKDWEPKLPNSVVDMILRMPDGPLISYHMAKNPSLEDQFRSQPEYMHGIILGQLSATLKTSPGITKAPTPGKPVTSKPGSSTEPPSDPEAYWSWAKKHLK